MMFSWPEIVLLVLKIANGIMGEVKDQKQFQAGTDAEIAKQTTEILRKTQAGKAIWEKINAMSEKEVDSGLGDLEPK